MFATATRNFVEEVDPGGLLIPVSSLNDTLDILMMVVKRKRFWFWQKPKYHPTDFHLNDILAGNVPINPDIKETDFIKYNGTYGDIIQGSMDANFAQNNLSVEGKDSSKLQSSFGSLKKEEINVQKLLKDSEGRVLDMSHCLVQQTKERHRQAFGIVKERIVATMPCSVIEEVQQGGQCGGHMSFCVPKSPKVSLKENGSLSKDSNVTMEIPTNTTIAYSLIELEIKQDGCFELCLLSDTTGGFEVDSIQDKLLGSTGARAHDSENRCLQQELEQHNDLFQLLSSLPVNTRSSLFDQFTKVLQDRAAVSALQNVLDRMCLGESPVLGDLTVMASQKQNIQAIVELAKQSGEADSSQTDRPTSVLTALHLISSALDEMTNDCLFVLGMCCSNKVLQTMELLVQSASGKGELPLSSSGFTALTPDVYEKAEYLFGSSNVSLKREGDTVKTEVSKEPGNLPLLLCIAVRGLASLAMSG
ncbi:gasdermin Eb isoform X1 [Echeneis naucrates]|uniref:Gasdermin Eb n=1 Tax=Echeneis naucrates TaxID=173247 RepID=A0A665TTB6_ECHNA|nr:gasdermin-E isoform X1 [Echeneis naucrates]